MNLALWVGFVWAMGVALIVVVTVFASDRRLSGSAIYAAALWPLVAVSMVGGGAAAALTIAMAKAGTLSNPVQRRVDMFVLRYFSRTLRRRDYERVDFQSEHAARRACEMLVDLNVRAHVEAIGAPETPYAIVRPDQEMDVGDAQPFLLGYAHGFDEAARESLRTLMHIAAGPTDELPNDEYVGAQRLLTDVLVVLARLYGKKELEEYLGERGKSHRRYFDDAELEAAAKVAAAERKC